MDQLIKLVADKAGIDQDKARTAAQTVMGFLKDRLPGPLASQIDDAVKGDQGAAQKASKSIPGL